MIKKICFLVTVLCVAVTVQSQNLTANQYIALYKDLAIREMKRMGVPAAITLAQGLLETESGNSDLLRKSNNHFGIKCKSSWTGASVSHDDDAAGECFRTYKDAEASYRDHSNFLRNNDRYAALFTLDPVDYKGWSRGLKKAGYATNPKYPDILIRHIEQYNLQQYSLAAANEVPKFESDKYEDDKEIKIDDALLDGDTKSTADLSQGKANEASEGASFREMQVNNSKALWVLKGTSLLAVATQNNIGLSKLLEYNDLLQDGIVAKDQLVYLQKKSKTGDKEFCVVKSGETLYDIAQNNGVQLQSLLSYNTKQSVAILNAGTKIFLQPNKEFVQVAAAQAAPALTVSDSKSLHAVQAKEGLYAISKKYGISVQQLKDWNNLTTDTLSIGQQLIVAKQK